MKSFEWYDHLLAWSTVVVWLTWLILVFFDLSRLIERFIQRRSAEPDILIQQMYMDSPHFTDAELGATSEARQRRQ